MSNTSLCYFICERIRTEYESLWLFPGYSQYMFKVNNRNTRTRYEICSKITIKTPERRQRHLVFLCCYFWADKCRLGYKKTLIRMAELYKFIYIIFPWPLFSKFVKCENKSTQNFPKCIDAQNKSVRKKGSANINSFLDNVPILQPFSLKVYKACRCFKTL